MVRGIRGAIQVAGNTRAAIVGATKKLLLAMVRDNALDPADIAGAFFTTTVDLNADFPAHAARALGPAWSHVPLLGAQEMDTPAGLSRCLRILILANTDRLARKIRHVYLGAAAAMRPDLAGKSRP